MARHEVRKAVVGLEGSSSHVSRQVGLKCSRSMPFHPFEPAHLSAAGMSPIRRLFGGKDMRTVTALVVLAFIACAAPWSIELVGL